MQKLVVTKEDGRRYVMKDEDTGITYEASFEFWDVENPPKAGDVILWASVNGAVGEECRDYGSLRDLGMRAYGPYSSLPYMRKGRDVTEKDVMVVIKPDASYLLHRYYG